MGWTLPAGPDRRRNRTPGVPTIAHVAALVAALAAAAVLAPAPAAAQEAVGVRLPPATAVPTATAAPPAAAISPEAGFRQGTLQSISEEIANGILTTLPPSVAWLVFDDGLCTGTLIGCRTILSAAHCFCGEDETGADCQPAAGGVAFLQQGGIFDITSVTVHPDFEFGFDADLAVVKLGQQVTGVAPAALNDVGRPAAGSEGLIVGFGIETEDADALDGLKRSGLVQLAACGEGIPGSTHLCWRFSPPLGPAGQDSNTCSGDSGGPLFVNFGAGPVVAGVTSGGTGPCDGTDLAFDADVFLDRSWIAQQAGADLGRTCGAFPPAGTAASPILAGDGTLNAGTPSQTFQVEVPAGTDRLRVTLNGPTPRDYDLYVNRGTQVGPGDAVCASENLITLESCDVVNPQAGTWSLQASRFSGSGPFQLTATLFGTGDAAADECVPDATTLCIDDDPGDRRFRVTLAFDTVLGGGISGDALATPLAPLGITQGGIFAFTNPANPEVLVKVLDGCALTDHFWVFAAASTTVGYTLTVEDTERDAAATYVNPDRTPAVTVTDTEALATCP